MTAAIARLDLALSGGFSVEHSGVRIGRLATDGAPRSHWRSI